MQKALHEGKNHAQVAQVLRDVGDAYKGLGQQEQALDYYHKARQMQQELQNLESTPPPTPPESCRPATF